MGIDELNRNLSRKLNEVATSGYEPLTKSNRPYLHVISDELMDQIRDLPGGEELLSSYEREARRRQRASAA